MTSSNDSNFAGQARPARIALVTTELRPGGAERNLVSLAKSLDRENFVPHVYSLASRPPAGEDILVTELQAAGVPVSFVGIKRSWQFFTAVARLRELLEQQSPDLVQAFLFHANVVSAMACRRSEIPVVAGLRVAQREMLRQFVDRRLVHRYAAFVCVSQAVADLAQSAGRLPAEKVHVIPNGIDPDRFADVVPADVTQLGVPVESRVVLFMGRMTQQKGADILLQAASEFLQRADDAVLLLVGDGTEKSRLQQKATESAVANRIVFAPWQRDSLALIAAAHLVVIPSRWEGMSNVALEAAALGTPVVATDVEGVRESLPPEAQALIVSPRDSAALAKAISQALSDSKLTADLAEANRKFVRKYLTLQRMSASYSALYLSLIQGGETD